MSTRATCRAHHRGYLHRHLVSHLLRAGERAEVHRLLALETTDELNAWYEACDAAGELAAYVDDVDRAWRAEEDSRRPAAALLFQARYGAILASVASLAFALPSALRTALVRAGLLGCQPALAEARRMPEPEQRVTALIDLVPLLDGQEQARAIDDALAAARGRGVQQRAHLLAKFDAVLDGGRARGDHRRGARVRPRDHVEQRLPRCSRGQDPASVSG